MVKLEPCALLIPSVETVLQNIETLSSVLAVRATALSDVIAAISDRLCQMAGKVEVDLESESEDLWLGFQRWSNNWAIRITDEDSDVGSDGRAPEDLTRVSVARKARAFPLLLQLLRKINEEQKRQLQSIDSAFEMIKKMEGN